MAIPQNITKQHIEQAFEYIDNHGIPPNKWHSNHFVLKDSTEYPCKYLISTANLIANGEELYHIDSSFHSQMARNYLSNLGYNIENNHHGIGFLTTLDLRYFAEVAGSSYLLGDEDNEIKRKRIKHLGDKLKYLLEISMPYGFKNDRVNWQQYKRIFEHFWTRVFKPDPTNKYIFFVLGVNGNAEFFVKLDYSRMKGTNFDGLPESLVNDYHSVIKKVSPGYKELTISAANISDFDYDTLSELVSDYFNRYLGLYYILIDELSGLIVRSGSDEKEREEGTIIDSEAPSTIVSRVPKKYNFNTSKNIDWERQNRQYQRIGSLGEQLVLKLEKEKVSKKFGDEKAEKVVKQLDGKGYDILSFDDNGDEMHIEVKTTTSEESTPFYLTRAEVEFYKTHPKNYYLYRLYNYTIKHNYADRYILTAKDLKNFTLTPLTYELSSDLE